MNGLSFRVHGNPAPKGSKSAFVNSAGRAQLLEGRTAGQRSKLGAWKAAVTYAAVNAAHAFGLTTIAEPVKVTVTFWMPRPKTGPNSKPAVLWHSSTPDVDKLLRSTLDAIVAAGTVLADDRYCSVVTASKRYCDGQQEPGASIVIRPLATQPEDGDLCPG